MSTRLGQLHGGTAAALVIVGTCTLNGIGAGSNPD